MSKKYVYLFTEGDASMRELLGGKGANLAEMTKIGLPVPQGFTITTEACTQYYEDGRTINDGIMAEIMKNIDSASSICAFLTAARRLVTRCAGSAKEGDEACVKVGAGSAAEGDGGREGVGFSAD